MTDPADTPSVPVRDGTSVPSASGALADAPLFGYVLMNLGRQWRRVVHMRLAELGLSDAAWVPLLHLHTEGDGVSLKVLSQRVGLESSTLVRVVDLLEARGWVQRETDQQDRRSKLLTVTSKGRDAVAEIHAKLEQVEAHLLAELAGGVRDDLLEAMMALSKRMARELQQAGPVAGLHHTHTVAEQE